MRTHTHMCAGDLPADQTVLLCAQRKKSSGAPWHPESEIWKLNRDCLSLILREVAAQLVPASPEYRPIAEKG